MTGDTHPRAGSAGSGPLAIAFDLDGTLVDSRGDIACAVNHALAGGGWPGLSEQEIANYVGDGARSLLCRAARIEVSDPRLGALEQAFVSYYTEHPIAHTRVMPGALDALDALGQYPLALCTNKPRTTTLAVLTGLSLLPRFASVVAGGDLPEHKPSPAPLRRICEQLGVLPSRLVMVGDGEQDVLAARAAGARSVGVEGGMQALERLRRSAPDALIPSLVELPALIAGWVRR